MLYADIEGILKPVYERYMDRMNTMKTEKKRQGTIHGKDKHTCTVRMVCTQYLCLGRRP